MTLVTIHLSPGQTPKELIQAIQQMNGGGPVRTVSGRFGVLVDADLARRYLQARFGPLPPPDVPVEDATPPPVAAEAEQVAPAIRARASGAKSKSKATSKAAKTAASNSEEV